MKTQKTQKTHRKREPSHFAQEINRWANSCRSVCKTQHTLGLSVCHSLRARVSVCVWECVVHVLIKPADPMSSPCLYAWAVFLFSVVSGRLLAMLAVRASCWLKCLLVSIRFMDCVGWMNQTWTGVLRDGRGPPTPPATGHDMGGWGMFWSSATLRTILSSSFPWHTHSPQHYSPPDAISTTFGCGGAAEADDGLPWLNDDPPPRYNIRT